MTSDDCPEHEDGLHYFTKMVKVKTSWWSDKLLLTQPHYTLKCKCGRGVLEGLDDEAWGDAPEAEEG